MHSIHYRGEIIIDQYHISGFPSNVRSLAWHGDSDICFLDCWRIIHAISSHCYDFSSHLKFGQDSYFMFRIYSTIDIHMLDGSVSILHSFQIFPFHHFSCYSYLFRNGLRRIFLISCNHNDSDSCFLTSCQRFVDFFSRRFDHSHESHEDEIRGSSLVCES